MLTLEFTDPLEIRWRMPAVNWMLRFPDCLYAHGRGAVTAGGKGRPDRGRRSVPASFSTETGLITAGYVQKELVLTGGPYLHLTGLAPLPCGKRIPSAGKEKPDCAAVFPFRSYGKVRVRFEIRIDRTGFMETPVEVSEMPDASPRRLAMRVGDDTDSGGYEEVGIHFLVPGERWILFFTGKEGAVGYLPGLAHRTAAGQCGKHGPKGCAGPDAAPDRDWQLEERDPVLLAPLIRDGGGTRDFASLKSRIFRASMGYGGKRVRLYRPLGRNGFRPLPADP